MTYESRYEFMYMKNIVKSYLKSGNTKAPDVSGRGAVNPAERRRQSRATSRGPSDLCVKLRSRYLSKLLHPALLGQVPGRCDQRTFASPDRNFK